MEANGMEDTPAAHILPRWRILRLLVVFVLVGLKQLLILEKGLHFLEDFIFLKLIKRRDAFQLRVECVCKDFVRVVGVSVEKW
jgi:hypothetical protein